MDRIGTIIILLSLACLLNTANAQPVPVAEALQLASRFLSINTANEVRHPFDSALADYGVRRKGAHDLYYIFNFRQGGFILVSADQRFYPVLAYSFKGSFDPDGIPENCSSWLEWYEAQMLAALSPGGLFMDGMPRIWETLACHKELQNDIRAVEPLTTSTWSQFGNYNAMCPSDPEAFNGHTPVGCVALAMSQLMYYYRFPAFGNGSELYTPSYGGGAYGPQYVDFSMAGYDWSAMSDISHYPSEETAEICYHAGVSVRTSYKPESSGADIYDVPSALRDHFYYLADEYLSRSVVSGDPEWVGMLMQSIDDRKPVLYRSSNGWSGHVYLCDGYQDSTHFHFNWGWGGAYDGYYYIDALTPGGLNLNFSQGAVTNIYPDTSLFSYPAPLTDTTWLTGLSGSLEDGSGPMDYQDNLERAWLIQPLDSTVTNISLAVNKLRTEAGADLVRVFDGSSSDAPLLVTLSGVIDPIVLESSGPSLFVIFQSDAQNRDQGFQASYYGFQLPFCSGYRVLTDTAGVVGDGSMFLDYRNGTECEWLLAPSVSPLDSVDAVRLDFNRFDLADGDTVYVYRGFDPSSPLVGRFGAGDSPGSLVAPGNSVLLRFVSDGQDTAGGWEIAWHTIPPRYCFDTTFLSAPDGILEDGSGNKNYVSNSDCYYLIDLSQNPFVTIKFLEFELENQYDYLKFFDADHPNNYLYRFSGYWLPLDVSFSVSRLLIYFHSDFRDNFAGWTLSYSASSAGIAETEPSFSILPNPFRNELVIRTGTIPADPLQFEIFSIDGRLLRSGEFREQEQRVRMNEVGPGVYILAIVQGSRIFHQKIIRSP